MIIRIYGPLTLPFGAVLSSVSQLTYPRDTCQEPRLDLKSIVKWVPVLIFVQIRGLRSKHADSSGSLRMGMSDARHVRNVLFATWLCEQYTRICKLFGNT